MDGQDEDRRLLQRAAAGDADAMALLYRRCRRLIHASLSRADPTLSVADREDLTQQTFLEVWRRACAFKGESSAAGFLSAIGDRLRRNRRRREARRRRLEAHADPVSTEEATQDAQAHATRRAAVRAAVIRLPQEQRQAIELVYFQRLPLAQAGEQIGCSADAVRMRLHRAKVQLAKDLDELR